MLTNIVSRASLRLLLTALLFMLSLGAAPRALASGISGLYNTGVDNSGNPLADGANDAHYTLISTPAGNVNAAPFVTLQKYPIQAGSWMLDTSVSKWISHTADESSGPEAPGDYTYQTTFTVNGDPTTAHISGQVAIDSVLKAIILNGQTITNSGAVFSAWTGFSIGSGFVSGTNTLQFIVTRTGNVPNPSGLRCEMTGTSVTPARISGLYNTGVDNSGLPLTDGASESHYTIVSTPAGNVNAAPFVTLQKYPIQAGSWMLDTSVSKWISHTADESTRPEAPGDYTYQTTFTVTGDPTTIRLNGQVAIDSVLKAILLNGQDVANINSIFNTWTSFSIGSGFVSGTNTLQFIVTRTGNVPNPSGFRCEMSRITGLYNTGVDSNSSPLADGANDAHYTLVSTPAGNVTAAPFVTLQKYPIQAGTWLLDTSVSKWISHTADESTRPEAPGDYTYQTTFTVTGDPTTIRLNGQVAIDSVLKAILLNGQDVANINSIFNTWTSFSIGSGFVSGTNTLQFIVTRTGSVPNPSGLRCEMTSTVLPNYYPLPAWALGVTPTDSGGAGAGPSSADLVFLASGLYENHPGADIGARNPVGPSPVFARAYNAKNAYIGSSSPGLPPGWKHNYDVTVQPGATPSTPLTLTYPNGATETWTPGTPSGANVTLRPPSGTPYLVKGVLAANAQSWQSLTITFKDESSWTFTQAPVGNTLLLTQIMNLPGRSILLNYNGGNRLVSITDDAHLLNGAVPANTLLALSYTGANSALSTVTEYSDPARPRQINYVTSSFADGTPFLYSVSQIVTNGGPPPPALWQYTYTEIYGQPFLTQVGLLDPTGQTTGMLKNTIVYDGSGRVQQISDANGNLRQYTYLNAHSTLVQVSSNGVVAASWTQNFDSFGRATGTIDALGHSDSVLYGDSNNPFQPTSVTNRSGQTVVLGYDPSYGNLLSADAPTNGARLVTDYQYDYSKFPGGRMVSTQTGALTPSGIAHFDTATAIVVDGSSVMQPLGLPSQTTSPQPGGASGATVTTNYVYTALGNISRLVVPGPNAPVTFAYNYTSDPAYNYTQTEALGEPLTITDPLGHISHFRYDPRGNLLWSVDAIGRETDYQYNDADQLIQIQAPPKAVTSTGRVHTIYTYLYLGGPLQRTDLYDETNTLIRTAQYALGREGEAKAQTGSVELASQAYDPAYRLKTLTNGNSQAFSHQYDLKGNLTKFSHPLANTAYAGFDTQQGVFDSNDNLTQATDGNNKTIQFVRAPDDSRLTDVIYPAGTLATTHSDYDTYGRVIHVSDNAGDYQYVYDDASNITSVITTYHGLPAKTISATFNPDGSRASFATPVGTFSYSYNDDGQLLNVTFPWNQTLSYTYDSVHRLLSQSQSKFVTSYSYDGLDELLDLNQVSGTTSLAHFYNTAYDGAGNSLGFNASVAPAGIVTRTNNFYFRSWTYDNRDELTNERVAWGGVNIQAPNSSNYVADAADNLTTIRSTVFDSVNADNQSANLSQTYDGNGNPTDYMVYDLNDRLIDVKYLTGTINHILSTYRSDGLRASKMTTVNGNGGSPTYFLYDGTRVLCELDASGNVLAAYGYGGAGLAQSYSGAMYTAYTFDPMGNVVSRLRQYDAPAVPYDVSGYDAFGYRFLYTSVNQTQLIPPDSVGYGGQLGNYTDTGVNLVLMGYRFYSPLACRFLTRDPSGYEGGINLYAYCRNNPINHADPTGLVEGLTTGGLSEQQLAATALASARLAISQDIARRAALGVGLRSLSSAGVLGPVGVAAVAIPVSSYVAYTYVGVPLANHLYGPQTLDSSVDKAYSSLYQSLLNCFVAGTLIAMADGTYQPIETLQAGAQILSRDPVSGQTSAKTVLQTFARDVEQTLVLRFENGEKIETTPGHPFYVEGKGFVLAGQLALGNAIVTRAGPAAILTGIQNKTKRVRVYNFEVADFHTYFVGNHHGGLWVHNISYRDTFFNAHPYLNRADWVVHHVIPQVVWTRYPGLFTASEKDALSNLAGIPAFHNGDMHLSNIAAAWNGFYRNHPASTTTRQQIEAFARSVDEKWGGNFYPYR